MARRELASKPKDMDRMIDHFGVTVDWRGASVNALTTIALQADYSGCGYFWVPEAWGLEAFSSIGHLLSVTKRIKIGTGIVNIFSRSAGTIGMACATMNQIAPQRFLLGLGTSGRGLVEAFHGSKFEGAFKRTEEYVKVIRQVQSGEQVDHTGDILKLARFRLYTSPVVPPVPIYLGAIGEKNLELASRIADGAIVTFYPISKLRDCFSLVNKESKSKKKQVFSYIPIRIVSNEREEASAKSEISKLISFYIVSMGSYYAKNLIRLGLGKQVEEFKSAAANANSDSETTSARISDELLSDFCLIGTPKQILDGIARIPNEIHPVFAFNASSPKDGDSSARAIREISVEMGSRKLRQI